VLAGYDGLMVAPARSGLSLAGPRELLLPLTVGTCFLLYYIVQVPGWVVIVVALPMIALYVWAPSWAAHSVERFDRDLVRLLSTGRRDALSRRYALAIGMRLFAPPAITAERRAVVAAENGLPAQARAAYRAALREHGKRAPLRVLLGYAHACYAISDDREAIRVYRELLVQEGMLPGVRRNLAHALVRRGEELREALTLIDSESAGGQELELLRAVAHAKLGDHERARTLLERSAEAQGDLASSLRAELRRELEGVTEPRPA
jgi:tetratricopeptide (TPR) repeat protein